MSKPLSFDTDPEAERVQIELLRKASPAKKFALLCSLSETVIKASKRAIRKANPDLSEEETNLIFVENAYGEDLAKRLREYLEMRRNEESRDNSSPDAGC